MQSNLTLPKTPKGVSGVVFSNEIGETPANCNLKTRIIKLNPDYWKILNDEQRFYVLEHEAGHINLQSHSEFDADQYASTQYLKSGRSPKQSVFAISKVLPLTNYEQRKRLEMQLERASEYDYSINKNNNALKILKIMNTNTENELDEFEESFYGDDDNFGGRHARNRAERHDRHEKKKSDKITRKNSRAEAHASKIASKNSSRETRSQAKLNKSEGGESEEPSTFDKIKDGLSTVGDTVQKIRGKSPEMGSGETGSEPTEDKKIMGMKATYFYVAVAATVIVVGTVLFIVFKPKKAKA